MAPLHAGPGDQFSALLGGPPTTREPHIRPRSSWSTAVRRSGCDLGLWTRVDGGGPIRRTLQNLDGWTCCPSSCSDRSTVCQPIRFAMAAWDDALPGLVLDDAAAQKLEEEGALIHGLSPSGTEGVRSRTTRLRASRCVPNRPGAPSS